MRDDAGAGMVPQHGAAETGAPLEGALGAGRVTDPHEPVMVFGTCELTSTQLRNGRRGDLLALLMRHGVKRLTAERILEIHCGGEANAGRARPHPTSRGASSLPPSVSVAVPSST